jgi:hypothetical protein
MCSLVSIAKDDACPFVLDKVLSEIWCPIKYPCPPIEGVLGNTLRLPLWLPRCWRRCSTRIKVTFPVKTVPCQMKEACSIALQGFQHAKVSKLSLILQAIKEVSNQGDVVVKAFIEGAHRIQAGVYQSILHCTIIILIITVTIFQLRATTMRPHVLLFWQPTSCQWHEASM